MGLTSVLVLSVIFGAIGMILVESLIGIPVGLVFLLVSGILFIIGLILLIVFLVLNRGKSGSPFAKLRKWCLFCILVSIGIIIGEIVVAAKYFGPQPANIATQPAS